MKLTRITVRLSFCILILVGCNSVDKSDPLKVVKAYMVFLTERDSKSCYDLISTKSKEIVTYDEMKKVFDRNDSNGNKILSVIGIEEQEKDLNYPTFRRFKVTDNEVTKNDTAKAISYFTLINENNEWKRVWNRTLLILADEKYRKGDYESSISLCNKALELNPFDGFAYEQLAWCYNASDKLMNTTTRQETFDKITNSLKHAISLEPDVASHYNAMSQYYERKDNPDLAIEYLKKGLNLATNKFEKGTFLSNIGLAESIKNNLTSAKRYFNEALSIEPKNDFALYNLGRIYNEQKDYKQSIEYFERVDKETKLPDHLKSAFYYNYSEALKNSNNKAESKEYILKALELEPSNEAFKSLYESVK